MHTSADPLHSRALWMPCTDTSRLAAARQLAGKLLGVLSARMEPPRLEALLNDVTSKLPLPSAGPAKKFEEAEGALCCASYLLAPGLAGDAPGC